MAQWWERSPPTNVPRVLFPDPASYMGWVCCWFSSLLRGLRPAYTLRFVVPICRPREIVKQIGECKWRPDARAISVRHVGRFGKNLWSLHRFSRVGADFTAQAYVSLRKMADVESKPARKKGRLMKRRSTFLYHSGRNIPAFLTKLVPTTKTKTNAPICFRISRGWQIGTTNRSV